MPGVAGAAARAPRSPASRGNGNGAGESPRDRARCPGGRGPEDVTDASDLPPTIDMIEWSLPPHELLDAGVPPLPADTANADVVHARNEEIIVKKLGSFDIEARIVGRNAGRS